MSFNYGSYVNANANLVSGFATGNYFNVAKGIYGYMGILDNLFGHSDSNSAKTSYLYSKKLQQHQYDLNRLTRQTSFQDTRQSLENADYNPLLAVGQQSQGGTFGASMSLQDPNTENLQNNLARAQAMSTVRLNSAQAYNQLQQGHLTTAQASNLMSQSRLNSAQTGLAQLQQNAQAINNLHLPQVLKSQIKLNNNTAQAQIMNAQSNQVSAMANSMNASTNSAVGASQAWRNYNQSLGYGYNAKLGPFSFGYQGNKPAPAFSKGSNKVNSHNAYRRKILGGF